MFQTPVSLGQLNNYHTHAAYQKGDADRVLEQSYWSGQVYGQSGVSVELEHGME